MGCAKENSDLTPEEKECIGEICENTTAIRKAIQAAIDSLGLTKSFRVAGVSLMTEEQIHASAAASDVGKTAARDDIYEVCACCGDPPSYSCCFYPGCDPCS